MNDPNYYAVIQVAALACIVNEKKLSKLMKIIFQYIDYFIRFNNWI